MDNPVYMNTAIVNMANEWTDKICRANLGKHSEITVAEKQTNTEENGMAKSNSLNALNDHLMERIEWLTDRDVKGDELTEEIRRSEAVTKVAGQIIANANLVLKACIAADNSNGKMKLPAMIEGKT